MKHIPCIIAISLALLVLGAHDARAQWSTDPQHTLSIQEGVLGFDMTTDSLGGLFLTGYGGNTRTYCYYIDANGYPRWNNWIETSPVAPASASLGKSIAVDKGMLVTLGISEWHLANGDTVYDLRAQKIDSTGTLLWPDSGISISNMQIHPGERVGVDIVGAVGDGSGGLIVSWIFRYRNALGQIVRQPFRAQRITAAGDLPWGEEGVELANEANSYMLEISVSDGQGGIITVYYANGIGAQRVSIDGETLWGETGVQYHFENNTSPRYALADGNGGVVVTAHVNSNRDQVSAFRLDSNGQELWGDGIIVKDVDYHFGEYLHYNYLTQASDSVFFVNWVGDGEEEPRSLVQAINLRGELLWDWPGLTVCDADTIGHTMHGAQSANSVIYGWTGYRPSNEPERAFYCQRIAPNGQRLWANDGVMLLDRSGTTISSVYTDCYGGAIFLIGNYLQHINRDGELGIPLTIRAIGEPPVIGELSYSLFPNPTNGMATVRFGSPTGKNISMVLLDIQGRVVFNDLILAGSSARTLDISSFPSGSYLLQLQAGARNSSQTLNIIK